MRESLGSAKVEVVRANKVVAQGTIVLPGVSPSVFSFNSDGKGVPAGYVTRVKTNGEQSNEAIHKYDAAQRKYVPTVIVRKSGESIYLIIYGTGYKAASDSDGNSANGVAEMSKSRLVESKRRWIMRELLPSLAWNR